MRYAVWVANIFAVLMILMGLLWIGQGLNIIRWPASSFMLGDPRWSWNGTILALVGVLFLYTRRR
jgi:amino acid transporter